MDSIAHPAFKVMLHSYYEAAFGPVIIAVNDYMKEQGIDPETAEAHAGIVSGFHCSFDNSGFFYFDQEGEKCLVFEVLDEDAATTIDLCAFAVAAPERFGTAMGNAPILGLTNVTNPASWAFGKVLPIYRTPLEWLREGCSGVCILSHRDAPAMLGEALGPLLATDEAHARDLRGMLCTPPVNPKNIVFKATARRAA